MSIHNHFVELEMTLIFYWAFQGIVFVLGFVVLALVFVVEKLGTIFQIVISLSGLAAGTVLGLFTAGMLSRKFNTKVNSR